MPFSIAAAIETAKPTMVADAIPVANIITEMVSIFFY